MDVVIYARLSQEDPDARVGEATATERQIADCRARAEAEGWNVLAVFEDPDHSASNLRRPRPDFERMLADLGDGLHADLVITYKLDRLLRHPKEAERVIELADQRGFGIVSLNDPGIDLTTPTGRAMFRMTITWAKLETETSSLRIRRKAREIAATGRPSGGGIRCFGLTPDRLTIIPSEAALIREAARRLIDGSSVHSIVTDWNTRCVRTPGRSTAPEGRKWEASSLKRMILAPRIVGDRSHHGVVTGTGIIAAILDRETWDQLRAVLSAPRGGVGPRVRKHYLTGILRCGRCGAKLTARPDANGTTRYSCHPPRGCGRIVIAASRIEPLVSEAIALRLDSPEFRAAVAERSGRNVPPADLVQLRGDEQALEEAASAYFVERTISKPEYSVVREKLEGRIDAARRRLERTTHQTGLGRLASIDIRSEWATHPAAWRNEVADLLIDTIVVNPATRLGTTFDPSRVELEWKV